MSAESEGKARITSFGAEEEANEAARTLLEAGIAPIVESDLDPVTEQPRHWVLTLPVDATRAYDTLGVSPPEKLETVQTDAPITKDQARWTVPREKLGRYIALYIVLVIVVCSTAFLVTAWLLGGFDADPGLPEDHPLNTTTTL